MTKAELGVYVNGGANARAVTAAESIKGPGVLHIRGAAQLKSLEQFPSRFIVAGGEGSIIVVRQAMLDRGETIPLGLLGGGTQNVIFRKHVEAGRAMTIDDFRGMPVHKFQERFLFRSGRIGETIFNNQFAIGAFERGNGDINRAITANKTLKMVLGKYRPLLVRVSACPLTAVRTFINGGRMVDMFSITSDLGNVQAFPKQDLFGSHITHAYIENNMAAVLNFSVTLALWQLRKIPQDFVWKALKVEQAESFRLKTSLERAWIDGDTVQNPAGGELEVRRDEPIPVVALRVGNVA